MIYVTGDSGGGKSSLLRAFKNFFGEESIELNDLQINSEETLVEGVGKDVKEAIEILSLCGLNDAFLFLRKYKELSDGQKYRYKLAKLVNCKEKNVWLVDEFCASLDRVMAKVVAYSFQKLARKLGKTVVVATTHEDLSDDFQPDITVRKGFEGEVTVDRRDFEAKPCSLLGAMRLEEGSFEDYEKLKRFHYRSTNEKEKHKSSNAELLQTRLRKQFNRSYCLFKFLFEFKTAETWFSGSATCLRQEICTGLD